MGEEGEGDHKSDNRAQREVDLRRGYLILYSEDVYVDEPRIYKITTITRGIKGGVTAIPDGDRSSSTISLTYDEAIGARVAYISWKKQGGSVSTDAPARTSKSRVIDGMRKIKVLLSHSKCPTGLSKDNTLPDAVYFSGDFDASKLINAYKAGVQCTEKMHAEDDEEHEHKEPKLLW